MFYIYGTQKPGAFGIKTGGSKFTNCQTGNSPSIVFQSNPRPPKKQYHSIASPLSHRQTVCLRESSISPKNQSLKNDISNHKNEPRIVILEIQDHLVLVDFNPLEKYSLANHESCSDLSGYAKPGP